MSRALDIQRAGPGVTVQDGGRPGYLAQGLSRGGAVDRLALAEGAALLGQQSGLAALELAGAPLALTATAPLRIALTGAEMHARCDGRPLAWGASHAMPADARLDIAPQAGGYGYLHVGGGIATAPRMGARGAHLAAGLGSALDAGARLPVGPDPGGPTGLCLPPAPPGGTLRAVAGLHAALFGPEARARLERDMFTKDARGNRTGQRLVPDQGGFATPEGLRIVSEAVVPGDIQITGDGTPVVLLAECQTTGGYPRIATVLPADLPALLRAPAGAPLRLRLLPLAEAAAVERAEAARRAGLAGACRPLHRDPHEVPDLLGYQLISGASAGDELSQEGT